MRVANNMLQGATFRRPMSGRWGGHIWFITSGLGTILGMLVVTDWLHWGVLTTEGGRAADGEQGIVIVMFGSVLLVCWIAFLYWVARRYNELHISSEGLVVVYPLGQRRMIPWRDMKELEEHLPHWARWILRTTDGSLTITWDLENCMQLVATLSNRVPVIRPQITKDRQSPPMTPPWHRLAAKTYRSQTNLGWLIAAGFLGGVLLVWYIAVFCIIKGQPDAVPAVVFAAGWSSLMGPMGWWVLADWRRFRGMEVRVTRASIEVTDGYGKHTAYRWSDVVGVQLILRQSVSVLHLAPTYMVITREGMFRFFHKTLLNWGELNQLILEVATFNLRKETDSEEAKP